MADRPYPAKTKVLYIGGTGRTGSTLLTRLLGEVPGWFPGGELAFLWRYGLMGGGRCSCGQQIESCDLWSAVLSHAAASGTRIDAERMVALRKRCWSAHLPLMLSARTRERLLDRLEEFPSVIEQVYTSLAEVSGSTLIVDSSKEPHYSWLLRERTDLDLYFLHLVRDARAVAHSWTRRRRESGLSGEVEMERRGPLEAAAYYDVSNVAAEAIWSSDRARYRVLRYEDFVEDPGGALAEIAAFVNEPLASPLDGDSFQPTVQHVAWGNPGRFGGGVVEIRRDDEWRESASRTSSVIAGLATAPVARRYGYQALRRSTPRQDIGGRLSTRQLGHIEEGKNE